MTRFYDKDIMKKKTKYTKNIAYEKICTKGFSRNIKCLWHKFILHQLKNVLAENKKDLLVFSASVTINVLFHIIAK